LQVAVAVDLLVVVALVDTKQALVEPRCRLRQIQVSQ
jgi:hypothetical protein